jgi:hypothetical protein
MTTPGIRSAREVAHEAVLGGANETLCHARAWHPDSDHSVLCDTVTIVITADRSTLEAALTAREGELREAVSLLAETFAMLNRTIEGRLGYIPGAWTLHPTVAAYLASHPRRDTP